MAAWQPILDYWFGADFWVLAADDDAAWPKQMVAKRWFNSTQKDDAQMVHFFGEQVEQALQGELTEWEQQLPSRLALLLLLDQFPRNIYRATAKAFAGDQRALALVLSTVESGDAAAVTTALPIAGQVFFYMPLMHAESLTAQELAVTCFQHLHQQVPAAIRPPIASNLRFAKEHLSVIKRFGRFPHRNQVLGRESSAAEQAFLATASRYGQ